MNTRTGNAAVQEQIEAAAYIRGRADGGLLISRELNPYPDGSAEAEQWRQGHFNRVSELGEKAAEEQRRRLRAPCDPCNCGGRGRCLDVG